MISRSVKHRWSKGANKNLTFNHVIDIHLLNIYNTMLDALLTTIINQEPVVAHKKEWNNGQFTH